MGLSNSFLFLAIGWLTHNPYPDVFKQNFTLFVSWSYCNSLEFRCTEIKAGSGNNCGSTEHCDQSSPALNPGTIQGVHIWHSYAMDLTTAGWLLKPNTQTKQCFKAFARKLCMHFTDWSGTEANSAIIDVSPLKSPRHPRKTRQTKSVGKAVKNRAGWEGIKLAERETKKPLHVANALQKDRQSTLEHWLIVLIGALLELKGMTEARVHMKRKGSGPVGDVALDCLWTYTWWHVIFVTKPFETERVWFQGLHNERIKVKACFKHLQTMLQKNNNNNKNVVQSHYTTAAKVVHSSYQSK